jgi:hypothetical protein
MSNRDKFKSSIGFTDLLFNLVIGFVFLFVTAFLLINPIAKKGDVIKKAEYLIVIEWDNFRNDDVDLWVKDPQGNIVSFIAKAAGVMNLEKDDLGYSNDVLEKRRNGDTALILLNREVVTLRGTVPGEYEVMAHVYARKITLTKGAEGETLYRNDGEGSITAQLIKINPYVELHTVKKPYIDEGQQISLFRFTVKENNDFVGISNAPSAFITNRNRRGAYEPFRPGGN